MDVLTPRMIETIRAAARDLTGFKRRAFEAQVALDYLGGDPRLTETVLGWSRHTVQKGLDELRTGVTIPDAPRAHKPKTEDANPQLAQDIMDLVEPHSQTDPKFQSLFKYTRITARAVREMLIDRKGYKSEELPHESTITKVQSGRCSIEWGTRCGACSKRSLKKKFPRRTPSSTTSTHSMPPQTPVRIPCGSRSTPGRC